MPELPKSSEMIEAEFARLPGDYYSMYWLAMEGDHCVAVARLNDERGQDKSDLLNLEVMANHSASSESVQKLFDAALAEAKSQGASEITGWNCARNELAREVYEERGFELIQTVSFSRKDLSQPVSQSLKEKANTTQATGIQICAIADIADARPDWKRELFEMTGRIAIDIPNPDGPPQFQFDHYVEYLDNPVLYNRSLMFAALFEDKMIGYSRVSALHGSTSIAETGLSGVVREFRRRGVVTALKVYGIETLKERGFSWICTDNDVLNPMLSLNLQLGYEVYTEFHAYKLFLS